MKKMTPLNFVWSFAIIIVFILSTYKAYPQVTDKQENKTTFMRFKNAKNPLTKAQESFSPDLEIIRQRVVDDLLEPSINAEEIKQLIKSIQPDGSWPDINYKDTSRTAFQHREHLEHMLDLSRAYKKPGSQFYQNTEVKKAALSALDFWIDHDFICQNWWWNEMGTPNWMINTLLIIDEDLSEKERREGARIANRANLEASGARPGGDLIQIAGMLGKQGLFKREEAIVERVVKVMASEIKISNGRGLQPDMSFHHRTDNVISTLTYGTGYAGSFAYWAVKIAGTKYTFPEEAMKLLIDYYLDGISKSMAFGKYPDIGAKNRDLSRKGTLAAASADIPSNLLLASNYRKAELENLVKIRNGSIPENLHWNRFFWHSEYFTHQRPRWFSSVRMHSSRQNNMEEPHNEEGLKNHHFADGSNFITITGKEYVDISPFWDWQKIPGTTIVQKPSLPHWKEIAKKGLTDFVGGVSDGEYGAAAFDFSSPHDPLKARKAWFYFNDEYVCLGTAINSTANYPVATTLNQCYLNSEVVAKTKTGQEVLKKGKHTLNNVSWIFHDRVAYLFPVPASVNLTNTTASGNWRQITHQDWATDETVQKDVFSLWIDHGTKPQNASYEYIVVPGIKASSINSYNKKSDIIILVNTPEIQAVQHKGLNLSQVVFYQAGTIKLTDKITLIAKSPCMVLIKINGNSIEKMAVSDPARKLKLLEITVNAQVEAAGNHWRSNWNKEKKSSVIQIDLPTEGYAGKSVILEFGR